MDEQTRRKIREIQHHTDKYMPHLLKDEKMHSDERYLFQKAMKHKDMPKERAAEIEKHLAKGSGKKILDEKVAAKIDAETTARIQQAIKSGDIKPAQMDDQRRRFLKKSYGR